MFVFFQLGQITLKKWCFRWSSWFPPMECTVVEAGNWHDFSQAWLKLVFAVQKLDSWCFLLLASGDTAPDVPAVAGTSAPATGCGVCGAAPFTSPASPAPPANGTCPLGRNVDSWKTGSSVGGTMEWWWKISNVSRKTVSLPSYDRTVQQRLS